MAESNTFVWFSQVFYEPEQGRSLKPLLSYTINREHRYSLTICGQAFQDVGGLHEEAFPRDFKMTLDALPTAEVVYCTGETSDIRGKLPL